MNKSGELGGAFHMDGSRLSPFPHHSWFGFPFVIAPATTAVIEQRVMNHTLVLGHVGGALVRWTRSGRETTYRHAARQIAFFPCDNMIHTHVARTVNALTTTYLLQIPARHLIDYVELDEGSMRRECEGFLPREDDVLRECIIQLTGTVGQGVEQDIGSEITARRLVLRLSEILGGKKPDWHEDNSVFTATVMKQIVDYIDSHLSHQFCLEDISSLVGLSPSHCAKKFRNTEGLSLCRFVNRRRMARAMVVLRHDATPLSQIALDLGFSSQSHFTRLFSDLTGMTPAKYRKQFRRTVG